MTLLAQKQSLAGMYETLIVDDNPKYRLQEPEIRESLQDQEAIRFYYTDYENSLIRLFHRTPVIGNLMSHILMWANSLFTAIKLVLFHKESRKLFINPIVGLFYCALSRVLGRKEYIGLAGLLFAHKDNRIYLKLRKAFTLFCCGKATLVFVYSRSEIDEYSRIFPEIAEKLRFIPYGRNYDLFNTRAYEGGPTDLASGGISNRDFDTLAQALAILASGQLSVSCTIATRIGHDPIQARPPGLSLRYDIRIDQFGDFLKQASLVVLPLRRTQLSSGHMVLLEAMSYGKPVIVADTPGVRDYVGEDTVVFYEPENPLDLAHKIRSSLENIDQESIRSRALRAHKLYWSTYRHAHLIQRLLRALTDQIALEGRS